MARSDWPKFPRSFLGDLRESLGFALSELLLEWRRRDEPLVLPRPHFGPRVIERE